MRFQPQNKIASKPKWSPAHLRAWQRKTKTWMRESQVETQELARCLDYTTKYIRTVLGEHKSIVRQPSEEFLRRLAELKASALPPKRVYTLGRKAQIVVDKSLVEFLAATCARLVKANARLRKRKGKR